MKPLKMTITSSTLVDLKNTAVRGFWFTKDFLSDFSVTFLPLKENNFQGKIKTQLYNNMLQCVYLKIC